MDLEITVFLSQYLFPCIMYAPDTLLALYIMLLSFLGALKLIKKWEMKRTRGGLNILSLVLDVHHPNTRMFSLRTSLVPYSTSIYCSSFPFHYKYHANLTFLLTHIYKRLSTYISFTPSTDRSIYREFCLWLQNVQIIISVIHNYVSNCSSLSSVSFHACMQRPTSRLPS